MNLQDLTVIIVTYQTPKKIILDCINSIDKNVKVLIIENSKTFIHKNTIISKFSNVEILCTGDNLGYGKGNNFGIKNAKNDYVLILNPDVICDKNFFKNITEVVNKTKNFTIIGCQYLFDKIFMPAGFFDEKKNKKFIEKFKNDMTDDLTEVEWVTGCSMLLNMKKFDSHDVFDKNYFLYFEEVDLCKSVIDKGEKIFSSKKLKVNHLGFKSSSDINLDEKKNLNKMREWHWMWSSFYFYKKNYSYIYAFYKMLGKFIKSFFKIFFYSVTFQKNNKNKYLYRFLGILNAITGQPSIFRNKK